MDSQRAKLPYRKVCNAILIYKGKVLCQNLGKYVKLPGGGVDPGESPTKALVRELLEETGARVQSLSLIQELVIDWNEQWHNNEPKKIQRFKQFRGEHVFMFIGIIKDFQKPTSQEGDHWALSPTELKKKCLFNPKAVIPVIEKGLSEQSRNKNFDCLYVLQLAILKMLLLAKP